jgi:chromosome partitioning protein
MIIAIINQKGGVGKSTISTNLAVAFALLDYRVLFIDADDQKSSLDWINSRPEGLPKIVGTHLGTQHLRKQVVELSKNYDVTIIDGKGIISEASKAALVISDFFIVPATPGTFDLHSTEDFLEKVIQEVSSFKDTKGAILLNMMDATSLSKNIETYIRTLEFPVFETKISRLTAFKEAASKGLSISEYAPSSKASHEFRNFFIELCEGLGVDHGKKLRIGTQKWKRNRSESTSSNRANF